MTEPIIDVNEVNNGIINGVVTGEYSESFINAQENLVKYTYDRIVTLSITEQRKELMKLIYFNPKNHEIYFRIGLTYIREGILEEARSFFSLCLSIKPDYTDCLLELGILYRGVDNDLSINILEKAMSLSPNDMRIVNTLAVIYVESNKFEVAYKLFKIVLEKTDSTDIRYKVLGNLATLLSSMGNNIESLKYAKMSEKICYSSSHHQTKLLIINNLFPTEVAKVLSTDSDNDNNNDNNSDNNNSDNSLSDNISKDELNFAFNLIYQQHLLNNQLFQIKNLYTFQNKKIFVNTRIKIGYVSSDFRNHVVAKFIYGILKDHNKEKFEVYCYYNYKINDRITNLIEAVLEPGHFKNIVSKETVEASKMIYDDDIDILVDLNGNTSGARMDIFAAKPAPVQVSYLGYPNTSGLEQIDYRITDSVVDSLESLQLYSEKLIRLDTCFLNYSNILLLEETSAEIPLRPKNKNNDFVILGAINRPPKNSPQYLRSIGLIMTRCPNAKLVIKVNSLTNDDTKRITKDYLNLLGIEESRLIVSNYIMERHGYFNLFNDIDILLDTWPYSGTTTTCDALYMSTPVITNYNKFGPHSQNVSTSIISRLKNDHDKYDPMNDLVGNGPEEFVNKAVELINCPDKIKFYKENLRKLFIDSIDSKKFMESYETSLRRITIANRIKMSE
jgi:protein O-GlcNAc transferase